MEGSPADPRSVAEGLWDLRHRLPDRFAAEVAELEDSPWRLVLLGALHRRRGEPGTALEHLMAAVPLLDGDWLWLGRALDLHASLLGQLGMDDQAVMFNSQARDAFDRAGDPIGLAAAWQNLACSSFYEPQESLDGYRRALELAEPTGRGDLVGLICLNIVWTLRQLNRPLDELLHYQDLAEEHLRTTWPDDYLRARASRAEILAGQGRVDEARELLDGLGDWRDQQHESARTQIVVAEAALLGAEGRHVEEAALLAAYVPQAPEHRGRMLTRMASEAFERAGDLGQALAWSRRQSAAERSAAASRTAQAARALEVWHRTSSALEGEARAKARAEDLAQALEELRRAHERIRHLISHDTLTGLHNRRHLMSVGERLVGEASPERPAQVALLDVDDFKALNDTYGHRAGDQVLRLLSQHLAAATREGDVLARYGGDELVVLRPAAGVAQHDLAPDLTHQLQTLAATPSHARDGSPLPPVNASIGVVDVTGPGLEEALHRADLAMYDAKRAGGARVVRGDAPPPPESP